jgi:gamma-glutamyltranspeptidase/glutathione hydrolase
MAMALASLSRPLTSSQSFGARDPAWAPDGARLAVSILDQIWVIGATGRSGTPLVTWPEGRVATEREPAWAPDGRRVAFAADIGDGFDLYLVSTIGGAPARLTTLAGDERWPTFTPDGRLVFAHRARDQWDLYVMSPGADSAGPSSPIALAATPEDEMQPRVSPDGRRVAFASARETTDGDVDLWVAPLDQESATNGAGRDGAAARPLMAEAMRVVRARGTDGYPAWAPDGERLAFYALRNGVGSVWVAAVPDNADDGRPSLPAAPPVLLSRQGGMPAWSPNGRTIALASVSDEPLSYDGDPRRLRSDAPALFALNADDSLRMLPAPRAADEDARSLELPLRPDRARWARAFDRVWGTLETLYYGPGSPGAAEWAALRSKYRPRVEQASTELGLEAVIDAMLAEQPLIKPVVTSRGALVVSAHPRASDVGAAVLADGGNVVDAAVAVSFALGVVEPDASGIGGDGLAIVYLRGMEQPTVIDFKDQSPIHATLDNAALFRDGRLASDGPASANIPGLVAGMDLLHRKFGSKRLSWTRLVSPAVDLAQNGFELDDTLPTTIAEGRRYLEKYAEARRVFLPDGRVPQRGDRFTNPDLAATLRTIADDGASVFYDGAIARRIAADMAASGGIIEYDDLAQYRAIERAPIRGRFRGHAVFTAPPPVASGAVLVETLQILDVAAQPGSTVRSNPDYFHTAIEAWKIRHPMRRIADPAVWPVELDEHLTRAHAESLAERIRTDRVSRFQAPDDAETAVEAEVEEPIGAGTTAFVVADVDGNVVAVTQTLSSWGGSFYVSKGLGFLYNNHLKAYRTTPGAYGQLLPLVRSSTTNAPTLVFRRDDERMPFAAVGVAGNQWIVPTTAQIIASLVDGGAPAQSAVEAPRFLVGRDPADPQRTLARVLVEDRFPRELLTNLITRGHRVRKVGRKGEVKYGYASLVTFDAKTREVTAGIDPRRSHAAAAVEQPGTHR